MKNTSLFHKILLATVLVSGACLEATNDFLNTGLLEVPSPQVPHGSGLCVTGEFLYLQAQEEGTEWALQTPLPFQPGDITELVTVSGSPKGYKPKFKPGYRVAMQKNFGKQAAWDVTGIWMQFDSTLQAHLIKDPNKMIEAPYVQILYFPSFEGPASSNWKLSMKSLDILLGRAFATGQFLSLHPRFGFSAAWIPQTFKSYLGNKVTAGTLFTQQTTTLTQHNDFRGYGIKLKLDMLWKLWRYLSIYSNIDTAVYFGNIHTKNIELTPYSHEGLDYRVLKNEITCVRPYMGLELGLNYKRNVNNEKLQLQGQLGWLIQTYFQQNMLSQGTSDVYAWNFIQQDGNLSISGITASLSIGF